MAAHFIHGKGTKSSDMKLSDYSDELNYLVLHIYLLRFQANIRGACGFSHSNVGSNEEQVSRGMRPLSKAKILTPPGEILVVRVITSGTM